MRKNKPLPSRDVLHQILEYDPETGTLTYRQLGPEWFKPTRRFPSQARANIWNGRCAGKPALNVSNSTGYFVGSVLGVSYLAHRVIWKMVHDEEPEAVDHIDGNRKNNRIENLRAVTAAENTKNTKLSPKNTSGHCGVVKTPWGWRAQAKLNRKVYNLGTFADIESARIVAQGFRAKNGFHPLHGTLPPPPETGET